MKKVLRVLTAFAVISLGSAWADSVTLGPGSCGDSDCGPLVFVVNTTNSTASLTVTNTDSITWYLQMFSLNVFSGNITATDNGNTGGETITITQDANGSNGILGSCDGGGPKSAFCVLVTSDGAISAGTSVTYNFNIAGGTALSSDSDDWHLKALVTRCDTERCDDPVAISTGPGNGTAVPEPASMALLGTGMLGVGTFLRRRLGI